MNLDIFQWSLSNEYRRSQRNSNPLWLPFFLTPKIHSILKDVIRRLRRQKRETTKRHKNQKRIFEVSRSPSFELRLELICTFFWAFCAFCAYHFRSVQSA